MTPVPVTLFAEDLQSLAAALPSGQRYPALESIMARGRPLRMHGSSPNHLRYELFGAGLQEQPAVAALCRLADGGDRTEDSVYWLRADPVTLRADMSRVFMLSCGFADMDRPEREELTRIVRDALRHEGLELVESSGGHWLIALPEPPGFDFTDLQEALGRDMADVLPETPDATVWKKRMTDIQVELHQSGLMQNRRQAGRQEINSVWFWGGGRLPPVEQKKFSSVISRDPVSTGLALLAGSPVASEGRLSEAREPVLLDWLMTSADAGREAGELDLAAARLLRSPAVQKHGLLLLAGNGQAWQYRGHDRLKIWRKPVPMFRHFSPENADV